MLDGPSNRAKAQVTADPNRNPTNKASAEHYMQQAEIKKKASTTLGKIMNHAKKHKMPQVKYLTLYCRGQNLQCQYFNVHLNLGLRRDQGQSKDELAPHKT